MNTNKRVTGDVATWRHSDIGRVQRSAALPPMKKYREKARNIVKKREKAVSREKGNHEWTQRGRAATRTLNR